MHERKERLKIVYLLHDIKGPAFHLAVLPSMHLNNSGLMEAKPLTYQIRQEILSGDIIVFCRAWAKESISMAQYLKSMGKAVIYHMDDHFWAMPYWSSPTWKEWHNDAHLPNVEKLIKVADAMTCDSPLLAETISKEHNIKAYAVPNSVDWDAQKYLPDIPRKNDGTVRIGYTSTAFHHFDIQYIMHSLKDVGLMAKRIGKEIVFVNFGYDNLRVNEMLTSNGIQIERYGWVKIEEYYKVLMNLDLDIGVVPLTRNLYNECKALLKWEEFCMCRIPSVVSPVGQYKDLPPAVVHMAKRNSHKNWTEMLWDLVKNDDDRKAKGLRAEEYARKHHNFKTNISEYARIYTEIYENRRR